MRSIENKGVISISIDTELAWGFINYPNHPILNLLRSDPSFGRQPVFKMLELFNKYKIPVTWAITGHLFLESCDAKHLDMPKFKDDWYKFDLGSNITNNPLYYGSDIVERIMASDTKHEIACHTFSHVPFADCTKDVADAELKKSIKIAKKMDITFKSFVFPETKIGHIDILKNNGFSVFRGINYSSITSSETFSKITGKFSIPTVVVPTINQGMYEVPGSIHFTDPQLPFLLLQRCKYSVNQSIQKNKIFSIILHCWSPLIYKNMTNDLEKLLEYIAKKRDNGDLKISTLGDIPNYFQ